MVQEEIFLMQFYLLENKMEIELEAVSIDEKAVLRKLLKDYQREIKGIKEPDEYKYLDSYWEDVNRFAFFVKVGESIGGFVLVNRRTVLKREANSIAEFYILKCFRGGGIGRKVAVMVFERLKGKWEVAEMMENKLAQKFWRSVIGDYTGDKYEEIMLDNEKWQGPVQIFSN